MLLHLKLVRSKILEGAYFLGKEILTKCSPSYLIRHQP